MSPHKVGPDYIDPGYHALAAGRPGRNLDPWLVGEDQIAPMFAHGARTPETADIAVIEGVMGLFDGAQRSPRARRGISRRRRTWRGCLRAPVVLVVDAHGVGVSAAALLHGFTTWDPETRIGGVIFNRVGSPRHEELLRAAAEAAGVPVLGVLRRRDSAHPPVPPPRPRPRRGTRRPGRRHGRRPGRHRGRQRRPGRGAAARPQCGTAAWQRTVKIKTSPPNDCRHPLPRPRVAIAAGPAFTFGYAEHPELLAAAGAEVVTFDPLRDEKLPGDVDGLVIGGGFPEEHAADLSANAALRAQVKALARAGRPGHRGMRGPALPGPLAGRAPDVRGA